MFELDIADKGYCFSQILLIFVHKTVGCFCAEGEQLNLRKLRHLAFHLTESHRYGDFILALCRNLEWLYYRCKAFSVCVAIADFKMAADAITTDLETPERKVIFIRLRSWQPKVMSGTPHVGIMKLWKTTPWQTQMKAEMWNLGKRRRG